MRIKTEQRSDKSLGRHLGEIGEFYPLSPEEEVDLARRIRQGDEEALDKFIKANLRFVIGVAKEYQNQGLSLQDLISEGNLGLIKAARRFDETRGFKFISYAVWWIRQSILQALAEQPRPVRLPLNVVGVITKIGSTVDTLAREYEREPSLDEIAARLDMERTELDKALGNTSRHRSLDQPFETKTDDGNCLLDVLENEGCLSPDQELISQSLRDEIENTLDTLKPREAEIVRLYFGLGDKERPLTLEEIGEFLCLTRERVRQVKEKALKRLRYSNRMEPLRKYLG
jgi:RNA polymerase primary sigma factor